MSDETENTSKEDLSITGGCLCGAIRYESTKAPHQAGYCHCTMCQKGLGNLFGAFVGFKTENFRYLADEPNWYITSDRIKRGFCGICGSPIAYQQPDADSLSIWIGTLDNRETYQPQFHVHYDTKVSWADIDSHLPAQNCCSGSNSQ